MRRRGVGIAGLKAQQRRKEVFEQAGDEIQETRIEHVTSSMERFRDALQEFVTKHSDEIKASPGFRSKFHQMCAQAGVDPLASRKGLWAKVLGLGDFYYELGVQVVEVCVAARPVSGGMVAMDALVDALRRKRSHTVDDKGRPQEIGVDDVRQAIRKLGVLGGGFAVVDVGGKLYVRSVPGELDQDANSVLGEARERGYTSVQRLEAALGWDGSRAEASLGRMVDDGLALVDDGGDPGEGRLFWIPSLSSSMQGAVRGD